MISLPGEAEREMNGGTRININGKKNLLIEILVNIRAMAFLENLHLQIDLINKNLFNKQIGLPQIAEVVQEIV